MQCESEKPMFRSSYWNDIEMTETGCQSYDAAVCEQMRTLCRREFSFITCLSIVKIMIMVH